MGTSGPTGSLPVVSSCRGRCPHRPVPIVVRADIIRPYMDFGVLKCLPPKTDFHRNSIETAGWLSAIPPFYALGSSTNRTMSLGVQSNARQSFSSVSKVMLWLCLIPSSVLLSMTLSVKSRYWDIPFSSIVAQSGEKSMIATHHPINMFNQISKIYRAEHPKSPQYGTVCPN